jgi:hypothetical protein
VSEWTKQRLDQMINDGVEENLSLDYKRADALSKSDDRKKIEVTKDISSFANSSGGVLIYGIAEFNDGTRNHLPERLDPIQRTQISKEWLDQIIQSIQPRIEGLIIHAVVISEPNNTVCYIVEVPQSHTAHMARDHRYHKRHNFTTAQMEDYEVRDVMQRRKHPKLRGSIFVNRQTDRFKPEGLVLVRLENIGSVSAHHAMVEVELPIDMNGLISIEEAFSKDTDEGNCHFFRLRTNSMTGPIFPGSDVTLRRKLHTHVKIMNNSGQTPSSTRHVKISIFADEMPPIRATLEIAPVLLGWAPIENSNTSA